METINESIFKALKISEFSKIPFLFIGNPGTGKTTTVEMFCKIRGYELVLLRGSQSSPEEILGFDVNSRSEDKFTDKKFPSWYRDVKNIYNNGGKVLLFLDEITGANEYTQSALLNLIFDRKVSTEKLPDDLLIVAAGNYADNLSTQFNLLPPLMSRFCVFNVVPTLDDIDAFLSEFRGGLLGKSNSEDKLKRLDLMELKRSEDFVLKASELIEVTVANTTKDLIRQGKHNLEVTDMQDVYSDLGSFGGKLPGILTLRTMNYYKKVLISAYFCYGKEGLLSYTFNLITTGLVGLGLAVGDQKSGTIKKVSLVKDYMAMAKKIVNDLDKLSSTNIATYSEGITKVVGDINDSVKIIDQSGLSSLVTIFTNMENDKSLRTIVNPIEPKILDRLTESLQATSRHSVKLIEDKNDKDKINGRIRSYNLVVDLYKLLSKFVKVPEREYDESLKKMVLEVTSDIINKNKFKIDSAKKGIIKNNGWSEGMLLESNSIE